MQQAGQQVSFLKHGIGQNEHWPTMSTVPEAFTLTNWIADKSMNFIRERRDPNSTIFFSGPPLVNHIFHWIHRNHIIQCTEMPIFPPVLIGNWGKTRRLSDNIAARSLFRRSAGIH